MAREPEGAGVGIDLGGRQRPSPHDPGRTTMWAVALEGEEFAPVFLDVCDVVTALRLTRATCPGRAVRVIAVPRRSSSN